MAPNTRFYSLNERYGYQRSLMAHNVKTEDEELIKKFLAFQESNRHISQARADKIAFTLINWTRFFDKSFTELTKDDIDAAISKLKKARRMVRVRGTLVEDDRGYKANTIVDHIKILKQFLKYLQKRGVIGLSRDDVDEIRAPSPDYLTETDKDLLTVEEINRLLSKARNSRDRAFIAFLAYTGCRIGEACRATWRDIVFDEYGAKVFIDDRKTRKRRYARITRNTGANALYALQQWRNDTPSAGDDDFVFIGLEGRTRGQPLTYQNAVKIIRKTVEVANSMAELEGAPRITKRVHPHLFRKTAITLAVARGTPENIIKEMFWANQSSNQLKTYIQLSEKQIDKILLERDGLLTEEKKEKVKNLEYRICPNCHKTNPGIASYCLECGRPLTEEAVERTRSIEEALLALAGDPRFIEALQKLARRES